jgi:hypothetical protein
MLLFNQTAVKMNLEGVGDEENAAPGKFQDAAFLSANWPDFRGFYGRLRAGPVRVD